MSAAPLPPALRLRSIVVAYPAPGDAWWRPARRLAAVDGASLAVAAGEAVGLVGESGCGKSTLARAAAGLLPVDAGAVEVAGQDLAVLRGAALRRARRRAQLIFQDPAASLNARLRVGAALAEALAVGRDAAVAEPAASGDAVAALLAEVGLPAAVRAAHPHELSGGQRQRVAIARALAAAPAVLIADEPTSALDVLLRARLLALLRQAQERRGLGLLLISHDLALVRRLCARVVVMYAGRVVEEFPAARPPRHPYTLVLAAATPSLARALAGERPRPAPGEPPSLRRPPPGCAWAPRCELVQPVCRQAVPPLIDAGGGHLVRCPVVQGSAREPQVDSP